MLTTTTERIARFCDVRAIGNPALITHLPFQSKLGKCRIFPVIVQS